MFWTSIRCLQIARVHLSTGQLLNARICLYIDTALLAIAESQRRIDLFFFGEAVCFQFPCCGPQKWQPIIGGTPYRPYHLLVLVYMTWLLFASVRGWLKKTWNRSIENLHKVSSSPLACMLLTAHNWRIFLKDNCRKIVLEVTRIQLATGQEAKLNKINVIFQFGRGSRVYSSQLVFAGPWVIIRPGWSSDFGKKFVCVLVVSLLSKL